VKCFCILRGISDDLFSLAHLPFRYWFRKLNCIFYPKVIDLLNPGSARKPLAVRWSKKSGGFFVENLFTVDCEELDDLLAVLEEGRFYLSRYCKLMVILVFL